MEFKCGQCDKCYASKMSLSQHRRLIHGNPKLYPCTLCEYVSKTRQKSERHIRAVHEKIKETCEICDKQYSSKNNLHRHKKKIHLPNQNKENPTSLHQSIEL